jgi:CSLREA domain-containing protein
MRNTIGLTRILLAISLVILAIVSTSWEGVAEAGDLTVTTTLDSGDGTCDGTCTLREAITAAAATDFRENVHIPAGTYTLTQGELSINKSVINSLRTLNLIGAGQDTTIIQATSTADFRVLKTTSGFVTISGVTIRHGKATNQNGGGGGILNERRYADPHQQRRQKQHHRIHHQRQPGHR